MWATFEDTNGSDDDDDDTASSQHRNHSSDNTPHAFYQSSEFQFCSMNFILFYRYVISWETRKLMYWYARHHLTHPQQQVRGGVTVMSPVFAALPEELQARWDDPNYTGACYVHRSLLSSGDTRDRTQFMAQWYLNWRLLYQVFLKNTTTNNMIKAELGRGTVKYEAYENELLPLSALLDLLLYFQHTILRCSTPENPSQRHPFNRHVFVREMNRLLCRYVLWPRLVLMGHLCMHHVYSTECLRSDIEALMTLDSEDLTVFCEDDSWEGSGVVVSNLGVLLYDLALFDPAWLTLLHTGYGPTDCALIVPEVEPVLAIFSWPIRGAGYDTLGQRRGCSPLTAMPTSSPMAAFDPLLLSLSSLSLTGSHSEAVTRMQWQQVFTLNQSRALRNLTEACGRHTEGSCQTQTPIIRDRVMLAAGRCLISMFSSVLHQVTQHLLKPEDRSQELSAEGFHVLSEQSSLLDRVEKLIRRWTVDVDYPWDLRRYRAIPENSTDLKNNNAINMIWNLGQTCADFHIRVEALFTSHRHTNRIISWLLHHAILQNHVQCAPQAEGEDDFITISDYVSHYNYIAFQSQAPCNAQRDVTPKAESLNAVLCPGVMSQQNSYVLWEPDHDAALEYRDRSKVYHCYYEPGILDVSRRLIAGKMIQRLVNVRCVGDANPLNKGKTGETWGLDPGLAQRLAVLMHRYDAWKNAHLQQPLETHRVIMWRQRPDTLKMPPAACCRCDLETLFAALLRHTVANITCLSSFNTAFPGCEKTRTHEQNENHLMAGGDSTADVLLRSCLCLRQVLRTFVTYHVSVLRFIEQESETLTWAVTQAGAVRWCPLVAQQQRSRKQSSYIYSYWQWRREQKEQSTLRQDEITQSVHFFCADEHDRYSFSRWHALENDSMDRLDSDDEEKYHALEHKVQQPALMDLFRLPWLSGRDNHRRLTQRKAHEGLLAAHQATDGADLTDERRNIRSDTRVQLLNRCIQLQREMVSERSSGGPAARERSKALHVEKKRDRSKSSTISKANKIGVFLRKLASASAEAASVEGKTNTTSSASFSTRRGTHYTNKSMARGVAPLPASIQTLVLVFLTPRYLSSAQCVCRLWAHIVNTVPQLRRAVSLSFAFCERMEWFLKEQWGEVLCRCPEPLLPWGRLKYGPLHQSRSQDELHSRECPTRGIQTTRYPDISYRKDDLTDILADSRRKHIFQQCFS